MDEDMIILPLEEEKSKLLIEFNEDINYKRFYAKWCLFAFILLLIAIVM